MTFLSSRLHLMPNLTYSKIRLSQKTQPAKQAFRA